MSIAKIALGLGSYNLPEKMISEIVNRKLNYKRCSYCESEYEAIETQCKNCGAPLKAD